MSSILTADENMDVVVKAFSHSVQEVLGSMALTPVQLVNTLPHQSFSPTGDLAACMKIHDNKDQGGMIILSFSNKMANNIVCKLLGEDEINEEDLCDGIGEVVNMISGKSKVALSHASNYTYNLSLPEVLQLEQLKQDPEIAAHLDNDFLTMVFEADDKKFEMQCAMTILK